MREDGQINNYKKKIKKKKKKIVRRGDVLCDTATT